MLIKRRLNEGFNDEGTPDLKYYAFDWDDNILTMPTKIIVKNDKGENIGMTTEDFATYRTRIGSEKFEYDDNIIVGFSDDPFINFGVKGDKKFIIDCMIAEPGPSWDDFVECINNGSIFAIITARGHTPTAIKEAVFNLIKGNVKGINKKELVKNLKKFRDFMDEENLSVDRLIKEYLDLCRFYPVTYNKPKNASNPEQDKVVALKEFVKYIKELTGNIHKKIFLKKNIRNFFLPTIGFSDDDIRNVNVMKKAFEDEPTVTSYLTAKGKKTKY